MRTLVLLVLITIPAAATALDVEQAIEIALRNDPALRALDAERGALVLEERAAGRFLLDNPELGVEAGSRLDEGRRHFETGLSIEQPLRFGGQGRARSEAAAAALERVAIARELRRVELRAEVRCAFARLLAAREREAVHKEAARLAEAALRAAEERYTAGRIPKTQRNGALVESARAAAEAAQAAVATERARAELRALIGLPPDAPLEPEGTLAATATPLASEAEPEDGATGLQIEQARRARDEAAARQRLADAEAWPELRIGAAWEREEGTDLFQGTLSIELPLFERNEAARTQARIERAHRDAALESAVRALASEREQARARLQAARAAVEAWQPEAVEAMEENLVLATEAFRDGDIGFAAWIALRREALAGRLAFIDALEELALAQVVWDRAQGR